MKKKTKTVKVKFGMSKLDQLESLGELKQMAEGIMNRAYWLETLTKKLIMQGPMLVIPQTVWLLPEDSDQLRVKILRLPAIMNRNRKKDHRGGVSRLLDRHGIYEKGALKVEIVGYRTENMLYDIQLGPWHCNHYLDLHAVDTQRTKLKWVKQP